MLSRLLSPLLLLALAAPGASAGAQDFPGRGAPRAITLHEPIVPRVIGFDHAPSCMAIYLNETTSTGFYVPAGTQVELADDLHTTSQGTQALCAFDFGYYKPTSGTVDAVITFYDNTPADDPPGAVMAGPFLLDGLPEGANAFHVEVAGGLVDADIWMGVSFSDAETGLLAFTPATLGTSHDLVRQSPPGETGNFGGAPPADFFLGVYSSPSTPSPPATWGGLKAIYR
jgi:hypothetical protein